MKFVISIFICEYIWKHHEYLEITVWMLICFINAMCQIRVSESKITAIVEPLQWVSVTFLKVLRLLMDFLWHSALLFCDLPLCNPPHVGIHTIFSSAYLTLYLLVILWAVCLISCSLPHTTAALSLHYFCIQYVLISRCVSLYFLSQQRLRMKPRWI